MIFPEPLEQQFRKFYSQSNAVRARLMPSFALMMTVVGLGLRAMSTHKPILATIYELCFFIPLLSFTLYLSTKPNRYRLYQIMLAISGVLSGLIVASLYFRPSMLGMPSYFSMEVTWILGIWLILGLRFTPAAFVAITISVAHIIGIMIFDFSVQVRAYETVMLFLVNCIGAIACYQLEHATRLSFVESLELEEVTRELKALAEIDGLTGLNNRRTYEAYIDRLWRQCRREQSMLTIIFADIDHFKEFNDNYGHQRGDKALTQVAGVIETYAKRPLDFAARYGGEEFVLALHGPLGGEDDVSEMAAAREYVESMRDAVRDLQIPHEYSGSEKYLTCSFGVAVVLPNSQRSLQGAVQMADEALYQAKELGRNEVVVTQTGDSSFITGRFRARKQQTA